MVGLSLVCVVRFWVCNCVLVIFWCVRVCLCVLGVCLGDDGVGFVGC